MSGNESPSLVLRHDVFWCPSEGSSPIGAEVRIENCFFSVFARKEPIVHPVATNASPSSYAGNKKEIKNGNKKETRVLVCRTPLGPYCAAPLDDHSLLVNPCAHEGEHVLLLFQHPSTLRKVLSLIGVLPRSVQASPVVVAPKKMEAVNTSVRSQVSVPLLDASTSSKPPAVVTNRAPSQETPEQLWDRLYAVDPFHRHNGLPPTAGEHPTADFESRNLNLQAHGRQWAAASTERLLDRTHQVEDQRRRNIEFIFQDRERHREAIRAKNKLLERDREVVENFTRIQQHSQRNPCSSPLTPNRAAYRSPFQEQQGYAPVQHDEDTQSDVARDEIFGEVRAAVAMFDEAWKRSDRNHNLSQSIQALVKDHKKNSEEQLTNGRRNDEEVATPTAPVAKKEADAIQDALRMEEKIISGLSMIPKQSKKATVSTATSGSSLPLSCTATTDAVALVLTPTVVHGPSIPASPVVVAVTSPALVISAKKIQEAPPSPPPIAVVDYPATRPQLASVLERRALQPPSVTVKSINEILNTTPTAVIVAAAQEEQQPVVLPTVDVKLGEGWKQDVHPVSGKVYYFNRALQKTTWKVEEAMEAPLQQVVSATVEQKGDPTSQQHFNKNSSSAQSVPVVSLPDTSPLCAPWKEAKDNAGKTYYYNTVTKETTRDVNKTRIQSGSHPVNQSSLETSSPPLPQGWKEVKDTNGKTYYANNETKQTSWKRP